MSNKLFCKAALASSGEAGFLLLFLLPILLLLMIFFAGSVRAGLQAQARAALQSRLDSCAVRLAVDREQVLGKLTAWNKVLRLTALGIYAARGAKVATGPVGAVAGMAAEAALLRTNQSVALLQESVLSLAAAAELARTNCPADRFSKEKAFCRVSPALSLALRREPALFPDVRGTLLHRRLAGPLVRIRCQPLSRSMVRAGLEVRGDSALQSAGFKDFYVE